MLSNLKILNLSENAALSTLEILKHLNISNKKLPHIVPGLFAGASKAKLEELDLSFNEIAILSIKLIAPKFLLFNFFLLLDLIQYQKL